MPQILPCSRFRNNKIESRKQKQNTQIRNKYKNAENRILNSNKNIKKKNSNVENAKRIKFFIISNAVSVTQLHFMLIILLINFATLFMSKTN